MKYLLSALIYWVLTRKWVAKRIPHEIIKIDGEPYLTRFYLSGEVNQRVMGEQPQFFLHRFHKSDQGRELHNHPYTGTSLILAGGYIEERMTQLDAEGTAFTDVESGTQTFLPGDINVLTLDDFHRTDLLDKRLGCWTLFVTGPRLKSWGFLNRNTLDFFPYMSQREEREGSGPHSREKDAPNSDLSERESIDKEAELRRRVQRHQGTY